MGVDVERRRKLASLRVRIASVWAREDEWDVEAQNEKDRELHFEYLAHAREARADRKELEWLLESLDNLCWICGENQADVIDGEFQDVCARCATRDDAIAAEERKEYGDAG